MITIEQIKSLPRQQRRVFDLLCKGGRYSVTDIVRNLGQSDPRGHISRLRSKGIKIDDERITAPEGVNYKVYWLADSIETANPQNTPEI